MLAQGTVRLLHHPREGFAAYGDWQEVAVRLVLVFRGSLMTELSRNLPHCVFSSSPAAGLERLPGLLQQPAGSQSAPGPEEAGPEGAGLPAAVSRVSLQSEARSVELPRHSSKSPGQIPSAIERNSETHSKRPP